MEPFEEDIIEEIDELGLFSIWRPYPDLRVAVGGKTRDRDCRSQSLIFFEQYYYLTVKLMPLIFRAKYNFQLAVKVSPTKLTMRPSEFLFHRD